MFENYAETRYQVELVDYDHLARITTTKTYYTDDFFDAVDIMKANLTRFHHVELFDTSMTRILFNSAGDN